MTRTRRSSADLFAEARRIIDQIDRDFADYCKRCDREEAPRAKIVGDPNGNSVMLPAKRGRRGVLVAKTCIECGELRLADEYRITGHNRSPDPRCRICLNSKQVYKPEVWRSYGPRARAEDQRKNDSTIQQASRRGQQWTGVELETALREDLTALDAALLIGRTKYGVQTIRARHKKEIMLQRVAGVSEVEG